LVRNTSALPAELIQDVRGVQEQWRQEQRQVVELGGLHILGTERHEARRIDNQLRGRSGRQGDPGSSQFYLSLEDELMRRFGGERVKGLMERLGVTENVPIQHNLVDRTIEGAQERVEGYNFDIRKQVLQYDDVVNRQREAIYRQRRAVLEGKGELTDRIKQYFYAEVDRLTGRYLGSYDEWMQTQIDEAIQDFTSTTTDEINVQGILRRLGTILPAAWSYDPASLEDLSGQELSRELGQHIAASRQENNHLRLLLSDVNSTFGLLPLLPAGWYNPTLAGKGDPGSLWENWSALPAWHNSITAGDVKEGREAFLKDANFVFASITNAFGAEPEADEDELAVGAEEDLWAAEDGETDDEGAESAEGDAASGDDEAPSVAEPETPTVIPAGLTDAVDQTFRAVPLLLKLPPADFGRQIETVGKKLYLAMVEAIVAAWATRTKDEVRAALCNLVDRKLARAERQIGRKEMRIFERRFLLGTIDRNWRQYLTEIDDLRQGIGLEAFGQRDPLIEFKRQGFELFQQLQDEIDRAVVYEFFRQLPYHERYVQQQRQVARAASQDYRVLQQNKGMTVQRTVKVGRNDPCPCGSGKKYKQCHGRVDQGRVPQTGGAAPARPIGKGKSPRQR
jgi:preprotein translocase subunit SecA